VAARLRIILPAALAALAFAVPAASADLIPVAANGGCPSSGSQVFATWGDSSSYVLAPNGGFESGGAGWTLTGGAAVVSGNEPFLPTGTHSLSLPSGGTATSPVICVGPHDVSMRMFGVDDSGTDGGLYVKVIWYGLLNQVLGTTDVATFAPGGSWAPTEKLGSTGGVALPLVPLLGSTSARVQLTPVGDGSRWQIDDLFVDPWLSRLG
jgi:hypothetical protein